MKLFYIFIFLFLLSVNIYGQNDPQATKILDRFSSTAASSPSVSMKFIIVNFNEIEKTRDTTRGSLIIAKDQYKLDLPDNITWFDGSTSWVYLKAEKEVTITKPDKKDDSFLARPSALFTMYRKGYKTKYIEENASVYVVDLYPTDIKSELIRIRLSIGKAGSELLDAEYKRKDGIILFLIIKEYNLKIKPEPGTFTFNPQNFKGVEIIDMR
jgi:outer membrane lipoprotein-sorting protein